MKLLAEIPDLTPEQLAEQFWQLDDTQQAKFFSHLGCCALGTPAPWTGKVGEYHGLDLQMYFASRKCDGNGLRVMECLSQSVSAERLQPYLVVPQIGTFKHGSEAPFKEWQPIETAPKNGEIRIIIAEIRQDGEITNIDFDAVLEQESESWEIPALYWVWRSANGNVEEPTHWMPMPEIPSK